MAEREITDIEAARAAETMLRSIRLDDRMFNHYVEFAIRRAQRIAAGAPAQREAVYGKG